MFSPLKLKVFSKYNRAQLIDEDLALNVAKKVTEWLAQTGGEIEVSQILQSAWDKGIVITVVYKEL